MTTTEATLAKAKPCPFCGSAPSLGFGCGDDGAHIVLECLECRKADPGSRTCSARGETEAAAVATWNRRASTWRSMESAPVGRAVLVYRPMADRANDPRFVVKVIKPTHQKPWPETIPEGEAWCNPTTGLCHCSLWTPIPDLPVGAEGL